MELFKKKANETQTLELSENRVGLRAGLAVGFLVLGLVCLSVFLISLLSEEEGWQVVEPQNAQISTLGNEFTLNYNLGSGELSATKEKKLLSEVYTSALQKAYMDFDIYATYDGTVNVRYINLHLNEELEVSELLYNALHVATQDGARWIYLGPVQSEYRNVFGSADDVNAALSDPTKNEDSAEYVAQVLAFVNNPEMVSIELLGNNKVKLKVAQEYLAFLQEYQIDCCIDFSWLANAFIVDYVADTLIAKGYTNGNFSSYDGYIRYLNKSNDYTLDVYDLHESVVYSAALAECKDLSAMVFWRKYPVNQVDASCYYAYSNGEFANRYIDPANGHYKASVANIFSYSKSGSCAEIAMELAKVFIAETLDEAKIAQMKEDGMYSVWTRGGMVHYNEQGAQISNLYTSDNMTYTKEYVD